MQQAKRERNWDKGEAQQIVKYIQLNEADRGERNEKKNEKIPWNYENGLISYLSESSGDIELLLEESISCSKLADDNALDFVLNWSTKPAKNLMNESYVNLIPTAQGGSHMNGFKAGLLESVKEFCEFRNLIPKGLQKDQTINRPL